MPTLTPFLWFDKEAEDAAKYYASIFPNSKIFNVTRYSEAGQEVHGQAPGTAMTVDFELDGTRFNALNGGPAFKFNESVSFVISCKDQAEIDYYWDKLTAGGDPSSQQCGWLKDKFGLSWQVVPSKMGEIMQGPHADKAMEALLKMKKLDIAALEAAGKGA